MIPGPAIEAVSVADAFDLDHTALMMNVSVSLFSAGMCAEDYELCSDLDMS